jgi:hypothetical protein
LEMPLKECFENAHPRKDNIESGESLARRERVRSIY